MRKRAKAGEKQNSLTKPHEKGIKNKRMQTERIHKKNDTRLLILTLKNIIIKKKYQRCIQQHAYSGT